MSFCLTLLMTRREKDDVFILPDMLAGDAGGGLAKRWGGARGWGRRGQGAGRHALSYEQRDALAGLAKV